VHWPSLDASPYAGQVWAVEVELTLKPLPRTARIMGGLLTPARYAQVIYLTAPAARAVLTRAAAGLPPAQQSRIVIRDLPPTRSPPGGRDDCLFLDQAHRLPVAAPQDGQGSRLAAPARDPGRALAGTIVTILGYQVALRRGWPTARLRRAAAATLTLTGLYAPVTC
jgi:hypothetical protein